MWQRKVKPSREVFFYRVSQDVDPLNEAVLSGSVPPMDDLNDRARERLRYEKQRKNLSERDLAGITGWTPSRVAQKLTGRTPITLNELATLCFAVGILPTEAVRDHGLEFSAELTPTELRLIERFRQLTVPSRDAVITLINVNRNTMVQTRHAGPLKKNKGPKDRP